MCICVHLGATASVACNNGMPACRGSPCELPEETIEGYQAALDHGIDFIELDAVRRHVLGMLQPVAH